MKIELVESNEQWGNIKKVWNDLLEKSKINVPFLTYQWQKIWWDFFGNDKELRIFVGYNIDGTVSGIAPFYAETSENGRRIYRFIGGEDISDYLDFIVEKDCEAEFIKSVLSYIIKEEKWDEFRLFNIPDESNTSNALQDYCRANSLNISIEKGKNCPVLMLPGGWDKYMQGLNGKSRHELRRKIRKVEKELKDIQYTSTDVSRDFEKDIHDFLLLHRKASKEKALFMNEQMEKFFELISQVFYKMGWLRIYFLSSGNIRISALMCFDYQDNIYLYNSGYDPEYSSVSPGMALLGYCIKDSILREKKIFDFMRGNERYKYELGAVDAALHNVLIFR